MWKKENAVNTIKDRTRDEEIEKKKESQEKKTLP